MQVKLQEALLRRKELQDKVHILKNFKDKDLMYEVRGNRVKVSDGFDDINVNFPKLEANQVTAEYDFHARQLRLVDAAIQQANWITSIEIEDMIMLDFTQKK